MKTKDLAETRNMKSNIFFRPNLKAIMFGSLLVVVAQHFMTDGHSQTRRLLNPLSASAREPGNDGLRELIQTAADSPSAEAYLRLSYYFEKRGNYRQALYFLRNAERFESSEDLN